MAAQTRTARERRAADPACIPEGPACLPRPASGRLARRERPAARPGADADLRAGAASGLEVILALRDSLNNSVVAVADAGAVVRRRR